MNKKITSKYQVNEVNWVNTIFLFLTPVLGIVFVWAQFKFEGFSWTPIIIGLIFYYFTGLSITAGYHRLFSHRAYQAHPIVKLFFLLFGAAAFQNSALKWSADHRVHHNNCDEEKDPYSTKDGIFWAHMGWVLYKRGPEDLVLPKDLTKDPLVVWQDKYIFEIGAFMGFIVPGLIGFALGCPIGAMAWVALVRIVLVHHATFFINSLCHVVGKSTFTDSHTAKDNYFMAFLTFGEGYHNFHHTFPNDYRNGFRWYHFDPSKWLIKVLQTIKLTRGLKSNANEDIILAKVEMDAKKMNHTSDPFENKFLLGLKEGMEQKVQEIKALRRDYQRARKEWIEAKNAVGLEKLKQLKMKMELAQIQFRANLDQWSILMKASQA